MDRTYETISIIADCTVCVTEDLHGLPTNIQFSLIARVAAKPVVTEAAAWGDIFSHTDIVAVCLCHFDDLCLSLSSSLRSLFVAAKGKYSCEPQEAHGIHFNSQHIKKHRRWHCTHQW